MKRKMLTIFGFNQIQFEDFYIANANEQHKESRILISPVSVGKDRPINGHGPINGQDPFDFKESLESDSFNQKEDIHSDSESEKDIDQKNIDSDSQSEKGESDDKDYDSDESYDSANESEKEDIHSDSESDSESENNIVIILAGRVTEREFNSKFSLWNDSTMD